MLSIPKYIQLKKKYEKETERLIKLYDSYKELEKKFKKEKESLVKLWKAYQIQEKEVQELRLKVSSLES
jgi:hypothetical protein